MKKALSDYRVQLLINLGCRASKQFEIFEESYFGSNFRERRLRYQLHSRKYQRSPEEINTK